MSKKTKTIQAKSCCILFLFFAFLPILAQALLKSDRVWIYTTERTNKSEKHHYTTHTIHTTRTERERELRQADKYDINLLSLTFRLHFRQSLAHFSYHFFPLLCLWFFIYPFVIFVASLSCTAPFYNKVHHKLYGNIVKKSRAKKI